MSAGAVISLYSVHAQNIYSGVKRFEYRTRKPAQDVEYLAIYETGKKRAVTGIAKISGILEGAPNEIWELTKSFAGISSKYFKRYFAGRRKAVAYCISEAMSFDQAVPLHEIGVDRPPQSFQYISEGAVEKLLGRVSASESITDARYFIGGVHGVGKTTFAKHLATGMGIDHYSSSDLIKRARELPAADKAVATENLMPNQDALITGLGLTDWFEIGGILDGHFVLRSDDGRFAGIPISVFEQMRLDSLFVLTGESDVIASRIGNRDGFSGQQWQYDAEVIRAMQEAEIEHAKLVANQLKLPLSLIRAKA